MSRNDRKVVPLPGLYDRYVEKGIAELEDHRYAPAEKMFRQALAIQNGGRAHFGMILSLYQLGRLREIMDYWDELTGAEMESKAEFYLCLDVYVMVLNELEEYERAVEILKASLREQLVPAGEKTEKCRRWLQFFLEKMGEEGRTGGTMNLSAVRALDLDIDQSFGMKPASPQTEMRSYYKEELDRVRDALRDREGDPYIKSMILQDLKLNQLEVTVPVHKFGEEILVDIKAMKDITDDELFVAVKEVLAEKLDSENPSLCKMAIQLWEHFSITMFPVPIVPVDRLVWAAAVYQTVHLMNGMEMDQMETARTFCVSEAELIDAMEKLETAEKATSI